MVNLSGSRWAPPLQRTNHNNHLRPATYNAHAPASSNSTPPTTTTIQQLSKSQRDLLTRRSDALKFFKLRRRLKWKAQTLLYSYHRALNERHQNVVGGVGFSMEEGEAEMMFKIDFFEFYVLLERVLVHLLGMLGMVVTAAYGGVKEAKSDAENLRKDDDLGDSSTTAPDSGGGGGGGGEGGGGGGVKSLREELMEQHRQNALIGDSMMFHGYAHRFHANVLAALDLSTNPLHEILGTGVVRDYLGIAKEFRNRWKDAEEKPADQVEDGLVGSRYEKMLNDLKLEEMLSMILMGVETAKPVAEEELNRFASTVSGSGELKDAMMELDEANGSAPWEAMPDAMEWD